MKKIILTILLSLCVVNSAYSNQMPRGLSTDNRMKIVSYNENDIVTIHGSHFVSTAVYLDKKEVIMHVDIGDPLAWKATPSKEAPYIIFVEPQLPQSDTNMTIITSKRSYHFRLTTNASDTAKSPNVIFSLKFRYPDDEASEFENSLNQVQHSILGNQPNDAVSWNYDYSFYGSKKIAPIQAVDNGTFTVFKFSKHSVIPAIFAVDAHRNESIVNVRTQGDYVFVQGTHSQFTLRNGEEVTTVYNDNFSQN